jgi:hypothetical protein
VPPSDHVGVLSESDSARLRGDRHFDAQGVGALLCALRLEVMLCEPKVVEPELFRQYTLSNLVESAALQARVHVFQ